MGNCCLPIRFRRTPSAVNPKNVTLLLLGLDNSGKTTIVKRLAGEPIDSVVPTVGFSVILLREKGCHVFIYDLGGGPQIRDIWRRYFADAHGIIFVTDAHDVDKMDECRQILEKVLRNEKISGKPVLLLANKQDLEGALDEIDIVDRLDLEKVVNEQKCPTLVELCSALNFSKKIDVGIENGYKWLIRSIIRDYPALNNRVARDLARQEEENKVEIIGRANAQANGNPFDDVPKMEEKDQAQANGYSRERKRRPGIRTVPTIPGLIEEAPKRLSRERIDVPAKSAANSFSSEFFVVEKFQSDLELLNDVPNHTLKNFLVRPKSSGARLYGVKSEKKRTHRRKPFKKLNKTTPFTDISNGRIPKGSAPEGSERGNSFGENVDPFSSRIDRRRIEDLELKSIEGSKSMPSSRRASFCLAGNRHRHSLIGSKVDALEKREILLDVTKIRN